MSQEERMDQDPQRALAHEVMNHLHVILGNLELLQESMPGDLLVEDARNAAVEVNRLLRREWGR